MDSYVRLVFVKSTFHIEEYHILYIYWPPGYHVNFLIDTMLKLTSLLAENFNVGINSIHLMNPLVVRLAVSLSLSVRKQTKQVVFPTEEQGFGDVWRALLPSGKEFNFFSNPHKCHTRIDYFFFPKVISKSVSPCKIGHIAISNQATYFDIEVKKCG